MSLAFYIAIDGVVPIAKMIQQRERRFKSAIEKKKEREIREKCGMETDSVDSWDTNAISPGTEFMEKLAGEISSWINATENKKLKVLKLYLIVVNYLERVNTKYLILFEQMRTNYMGTLLFMV